jgi:hypothetical protein
MIQTLNYNEELAKFYSNPYYFSYSSINKLLFSPRSFYNYYILKEREDSIDAHLVSGRALHCLLLEPKSFEEQFIITPNNTPGDNNLIIIHEVFKSYSLLNNETLELKDFSIEILDILQRINLHQNLVDDKKDVTLTGDSKRLNKILTSDNSEYFNFLKQRQNKTLIDLKTYNECLEASTLLKEHPVVKQLLGLDQTESDDLKIYNEQSLSMNLEDYNFGLKGILDNIVIDYNSKTVFINDLKTTGKPIQNFAESVDFYNYWIQAVIYKKLTFNRFIKERDDYKDWKIIVTFIVIDKYNLIYPYQVSSNSMIKWDADFLNILNKLSYHYDNKDYNLPYELALGNITL